jgi:tetratricopeptide (TPR) repeat protein
MPPLPTRISQGEEYERCLSSVTVDPLRSVETSNAWRARGGGIGAVHCSALAHIATGDFAAAAGLLETLGRSNSLPELERAIVLAQSAEVRLLAHQAERALDDANEALRLAPATADLLILRANSASVLGRSAAVVDDLTLALGLDPSRLDALVMRAIALRNLDRLELAAADLERAISLAPDDPEALLERGILRQRLGNASGARADWQRVRTLSPNGVAADLADQNLALLEAGPLRR